MVGNTGDGQANLIAGSASTSFASVIGLAQGGGANCQALLMMSNDYNYEEGDDTCGFGSGTDDMTDAADPQLAMLANNGGPTMTRLPADTSPLVNAIPNAACDGVATDQRGSGFPRPGSPGTNCDIGAVELQPTPPPPPTTSPPVCPASAALFPLVPSDGPVAVLILGAAPFGLLRLLRRKPGVVRLKGRAVAIAVLVGMAVVVLAACVPPKTPPPVC